MIDFTRTEEERLLQETAARFANEELRDQERDHEKNRSFPESLRQAYSQLGFSDLNQPDSGLEAAHRIATWHALSQRDPSAPFGLDPVGPGGAVLEKLPQGVGVFTTTEGLRFNENKVSGTIPWVPRTRLDYLVLIHPNGLFLVDKPSTNPLRDRPVGLQACGGLEVALSDAPTQEVGNHKQSEQALAECRRLAAAAMLGAALDAHLAAATYTQERMVFGRPIAHHQGMAFQLADAATNLQAAQLLLEASTHCPTLTANAHAMAVEVSDHVCERSVQALGGHGYLYDHRIEKRMRDVRTLASLYGGPIASEEHAAASILDLPDPLEVVQ